jgi:DNA-directed RNA polymerase subunit RPC12/RpoP
MDIKIEQACPQCGAPIVISENDRLLTCPYCEVKNFMLSNGGAFRYVLQAKIGRERKEPLLYVPYLRFKGNIFLINEAGIGHKVMDTTQIGIDLPGLPPSLGVRPQAMPVKRLLAKIPGRYLPLTTKARAVLEKAIRLTPLRIEQRKLIRTRQSITYGEEDAYSFSTKVETTEYSSHGRFLHRAFIGETVSFVYLPVEAGERDIIDGVTGSPLMRRDQVSGSLLQGMPFNLRWQVQFMSTLCPRCGWSLDGEGDSLLMTCKNCDTAWALGRKKLEEVRWRMVPGDRQTALYLGFWKISGNIPALEIRSFADFIARTNQPILAQSSWHEREMSFWIPAFKLRPKVFLRVGRQATIGQWRLEPEEGHVTDNLYPVTLPASEAKQSVKVILAASTASRKKIFPFLPKVRLQDATATLVYLPFVDKGHDWYQPESGVTVSKAVLRFGRSL